MNINRSNEKRTALKLINKYADSYLILEEENKSLRSEIKDLKANLRINKEIIQGFFSKMNKKDQSSLCFEKWQEENKKLYAHIEMINKEKDELRSKLDYIEQTSVESLNRERDENEKNKNKVFIMENALVKKDNIIMVLKKRLEKLSDDDRYSGIDREIYVIEPTLAVTQINDELLLYKQIYDNLSNHIREIKESMMRYESIINDLQNENAKLRTQYKLQVLSATRERETYCIHAMKEDQLSQNTRNATDNTKCQSDFSKKFNFDDKGLIRNKLKYSGEMYSKVDKNIENEEYIEILRICGLKPEEMEKLGKNVMYSKLIEAIEMLFRLICDKNMTIRLLETENENLNSKNFQLNKENISLFQMNLNLKKELQIREGKKDKSDNTDMSMTNNMSRITINNLNINSMNHYQKVQENEKKKKNERSKSEFLGIKTVKRMGSCSFSNDKAEKEEERQVPVKNDGKEKGEVEVDMQKKLDKLDNCNEESIENHDSIIYTKDSVIKKNMEEKTEKVVDNINPKTRSAENNASFTNTPPIVNTLESWTSSECRDVKQGESFASIGIGDDLANLNFDIKTSNI